MEREQLIAAIAAQEQLRGVVPDDVVDGSIAALRARLEGVSAPAQRRRQVTVLFADVSGFTAMSESMDPELVAELMNTLWHRLDATVVEHGGRVDKHIGDALMAVWGVDATAEDDAERAVRAALALQVELEQFRVDSGRDLGMRIGVNTGPVLLGPIGSTRELTVMGDAVNTASRLEHAAPQGGVLISHDTYRLVRGVFDVTALEPVRVKGKTEPLKVYAAIVEKTRAFRLRSRGVEGVETSTIGRDQEFAELCTAFEGVLATERCRAVVVAGDGGIGKSRLLYEFDNWLELHDVGVFYFKARATRSRAATRFGLWRDLLSFRAGVTEGDSPVGVFDKLRAETAVALDAKETLILGLWLGFELSDPDAAPGLVSGENMAVVGRAHLVAYLRTLMSMSPVVILFEDIHWADTESLQLLRSLPGLFSADRLLAVAATRPEPFHDGSSVESFGPAWNVIELGALAEHAARALVFEILKQVDEIPETLLDLVVERADGNPFYIEELVKKLMDDGVIDASDPEGVWHIRSGLLAGAAIPTTLTGLLQARLDALPDDGRRSLQRASIVGRTFWNTAIEALGAGPVNLVPAIANELVFAHRSSAFPASSEFTFKHALLHDVTYETVLLSERPGLHGRTAQWLNDVAGDRRDEYLEEIAGHLLLAGSDDDAAEMLFDAASRALGAGDAASARRLVETGLAATSPSASPVRSHVSLALACRFLGDFPAGEEAAGRAISRAEDTHDDRAMVDAIHAAFLLAEDQGAVDRADVLVRRGLAIAERLGGRSLSRMLACRAWADLNAGTPETARRNAAASLHEARADEDLATLMLAHSVNGAVAAFNGDTAGSLDHYRRLLDLATGSGDLAEVSNIHLNMGVTWHYLADSTNDTDAYDSAERQYEAAVTMAKRLGQRQREIRASANLAQLRMRRGHLQDARQLATEALTLATEIGAHADALFSILVHAEASYEASGDPDALAHIGMVDADPSIGRLRAEVADIIERLRRSHPGFDIDRALRAGESLNFDDVVAQIIDEAGRSEATTSNPLR